MLICVISIAAAIIPISLLGVCTVVKVLSIGVALSVSSKPQIRISLDIFLFSCFRAEIAFQANRSFAQKNNSGSWDILENAR